MTSVIARVKQAVKDGNGLFLNESNCVTFMGILDDLLIAKAELSADKKVNRFAWIKWLMIGLFLGFTFTLGLISAYDIVTTINLSETEALR